MADAQSPTELMAQRGDEPEPDADDLPEDHRHGELATATGVEVLGVAGGRG